MDDVVAVLPNELVLVDQAVTDPSAFAALYDHYFPRVYNYIVYRVGDIEMADDLAALIFERALANLDRYRPAKGPFGAWLFAIARNAIIDHLRRQGRRRWFSLEVLRRQPSNAPQPEETAVRNEMHAELLAAVARLSQRERDLVALKFASSLTNRSIAQLTGLSESNVGVILYRALRKLRAELGPEE